MPDYAGQANAIYDPQLAADTATLGQTIASERQNLDTQTKDTGAAYTDALTAAGKTRDANQSKADFTLSNHGLWQSGLAANEARLVGQNYADNATKIETARAAKLADIAGKRQLAESGYATNLGNLKSKYGGLKSQYIISNQQHDADVARQEQQAAMDRASRAAAYATPSASPQQKLAELFTDYQPYSQGGKQGYTEAHVIPSLMAATGMNRDQAAQAAYDFRKQNFNE